MSETITIVGGGLAGLVAAISVAEKGGAVILHEASSRLGGRARTASGAYRTNLGPHAFYLGGEFESWARERDLLPQVSHPSFSGVRTLHRGKLRRVPPYVLPLLRSLGAEAPVARSYRAWVTERMGEAAAEAAIGFASLPTFHPDPGELSAAFVHERVRRSLRMRPVCYPKGGFGSLVDSLEACARGLGVRIETRSRVRSLPSGPAIVATDLRVAARLLGSPELDWPRAKTALLDVSLVARRADPRGVLDLDQRVWASSYSAGDPSLAPAGENLIQASAGVREGEEHRAAWERIEAVLERTFKDFRARVVWQHSSVTDGGAGPADPPGKSWCDRPSITRGADRWLVGDCVAAPGILSEVSYASARVAADQAVRATHATRARVSARSAATPGAQRAPARQAGEARR